MFIENRIRKETKQIVVFDFERSHREKLVIRIVKKKLTSLNERFFRTI